MKLIIDTNIFFSGLLRDSTTRKILFHPEYDFYIPDFFLFEYKEYLLKKSRMDKLEFKQLIKKFLKKIHLVPIKEYMGELKNAEKIIGDIDEKDIPFIALAKAIKNDGIWSNDKHFKKQSKVRVYNTYDLFLIFSAQDEDEPIKS